jgi:hypothetical protein
MWFPDERVQELIARTFNVPSALQRLEQEDWRGTEQRA